MSTRGVFGVRIHQNDKLLYNHSDSYPGGLGDDLVKELRAMAKSGWEDVKVQAQALQLVDKKDVPTEEQIKRLSKFADLSVGSQSDKDWYCLLHRLQGNLTWSLKAGIGLNYNNFIYDSLYCEWGYIVNLDTMKLEVYKGFQDAPHKNGRYGQTTLAKEGRDKHYGCALVKEYPLDDLPADFSGDLDKTLRGLYPEDYEDDE